MHTSELIAALRNHNFGLTIVDAEGSRGEVKIFISIINRKDLKEYISIINNINPNAFYTIEDVRTINQGIVRTVQRKSVFSTIGRSLRITK